MISNVVGGRYQMYVLYWNPLGKTIEVQQENTYWTPNKGKGTSRDLAHPLQMTQEMRMK